MSRILWLSRQSHYSDWERKQITEHLRRVQLSMNNTFIVSVARQVPDLLIKKPGTKNKLIINPASVDRFHSRMETFIDTYKPKVIVINDMAHLWHMVKEGLTLNLCRGFVYMYKGIPCLVLDELKNSNVRVVKEGDWIFKNDFNKLSRWCLDRQRPQPKFKYTVTRTVEEVERYCGEAIAHGYVSEDIETVRGFISSIAFTYARDDGSLQSFVVPFLNSQQSGNSHWGDPRVEQAVWEQIRRLHSSAVVEIMHNGSGYDTHYFVKYGCPTENFLIDTQNVFHSIWTEAKKSLRFIASVALDYAQYWKDENKNESEANFPIREYDLERYWRYNALDSYYTYCCAVFYAGFIRNFDWALRNYNTEFRLQMGPALMCAFTGMYADPKRVDAQVKDWQAKAEKHLARVRIMANDPEFNPRSDDQVRQLLYDIYKLEPLKSRGKKNAKKKIGDYTVDEKTLRILKLQNPVAEIIIEEIWKYKKAEANISKYGHDKYPIGGRLLYTLNASGTETGRFAGKQSSFWVGTQPQNVPKKVRSLFVADPGRVFVEIDYAQSDAKFVAFESEDERYIKTMDTPGLDTHSFHASHVFGNPYEEIVAAHETEEDWVDHPTEGVRQNTKRIVHGANFEMQDYTLFMTVGKEAAIGIAKSLQGKIFIYEALPREGVKPKRYEIRTHRMLPFDPKEVFKHFDHYKCVQEISPNEMSDEQLVWFCGDRLEGYHKLYTGLRPYFKRVKEKAIKNGNLVTCAFGRTRYFFGDIAKDSAVGREICAYYGQGATAGNINRVFNHIYYERYNDLIVKQGVRIVTQTHDSGLFSIPVENLNPVTKELLTIYEQPVTIHGRTFVVKADAKVGFNWGRMIKWKEGMSLDPIIANEKETELMYAKMTA